MAVLLFLWMMVLFGMGSFVGFAMFKAYWYTGMAEHHSRMIRLLDEDIMPTAQDEKESLEIQVERIDDARFRDILKIKPE